MLNFYATIAKLDHDAHTVYGYASTEALDQQGEIVTRQALEAALPDYMRFANIREMHQPSAVGVAEEAQIDDKGLWLGARVVDERAWEKVKKGVYKGFSIGGRVTARDPQNRRIITGVDLTEISLVDRPANPEAVFEMVKHIDGMLRPQPFNKWDCGVTAHRHATESDAAQCMEQQMSVNRSTEVLQGAERIIGRLETAIGKRGDAGGLAKSMQIVACLAQLLDQIKWLQETAAAEQVAVDGLAARLAAWLAEGADLLRDVVAGATETLLDDDVVAPVGSAVDALNVTKAATERAWPLAILGALRDAALRRPVAGTGAERRQRLAAALEKIGARNSRADLTRIQHIHDKSVELGAHCRPTSSDAAELQRRSGMQDGALEALEKFTARISPLVGEVDALKARLAVIETVPLPGRAVLGSFAVSKEDDRGGVAAMTLKSRLALLPPGEARASEILRQAYYSPTTGRR